MTTQKRTRPITIKDFRDPRTWLEVIGQGLTPAQGPSEPQDVIRWTPRGTHLQPELAKKVDEALKGLEEMEVSNETSLRNFRFLSWPVNFAPDGKLRDLDEFPDTELAMFQEYLERRGNDPFVYYGQNADFLDKPARNPRKRKADEISQSSYRIHQSFERRIDRLRNPRLNYDLRDTDRLLDKVGKKLRAKITARHANQEPIIPTLEKKIANLEAQLSVSQEEVNTLRAYCEKTITLAHGIKYGEHSRRRLNKHSIDLVIGAAGAELRSVNGKDNYAFEKYLKELVRDTYDVIGLSMEEEEDEEEKDENEEEEEEEEESDGNGAAGDYLALYLDARKYCL